METPLWTPSNSRVKSSNLYRFMQKVNEKYSLEISNYAQLHQWSVSNNEQFWEEVFHYTAIISSSTHKEVIDERKMIGTQWFSGCKLNFAENLLRFRDDQTAIIYRGENIERKTLTFSELYQQVATLASALRQHGVEAGDRVVGYMPNRPETVVAMLAATSLGAIWSSCSPDFGEKGVLDRFGQIQPKVLFVADSYPFKGRTFNYLDKVAAITRQIPSIERIIVVSAGKTPPDLSDIPRAVHFTDFCQGKSDEIEFVQTEFMHPLYIMYSSGTTGLPKCMVQCCGGVLINQLKELVLHVDLNREDTIFYFTTCGWMMWNWLVCSLAVGATIVLYDGNPFHPDPGGLWQMAEEEDITIFGTSAGYLSALRQSGFKPMETFKLQQLRTLLSTGSPLSKDDFHFTYHHIKKDLQLSSISGGSDLNGCFALGNPFTPVYAGELQCLALGMEVYAYNEEGQPVIDEQGDLVCANPFPSMPVYFWDDPDGSRYQAAYFSRFPGVWTHGDYIRITERGTMIIYGRSDATLNPGGVRIGTAEIYRILDNMTEVTDSLAVGQEWQGNTRVILFVKMAPDQELTPKIQERITTLIRQELSPKHVPAKIISVPDIPYTLNMKKVELAVAKIIHGQEVKNKDALKNPESLKYFANIDELST